MTDRHAYNTRSSSRRGKRLHNEDQKHASPKLSVTGVKKRTQSSKRGILGQDDKQHKTPVRRKTSQNVKVSKSSKADNSDTVVVPQLNTRWQKRPVRRKVSKSSKADNSGTDIEIPKQKGTTSSCSSSTEHQMAEASMANNFLYSQMCDNVYILKEVTKLDFLPRAIIEVGPLLYMGGDSIVAVYDKNNQLIRSVRHESMHNVYGIDYHSETNCIFVACLDYGLHYLNLRKHPHEMYEAKITEGTFSDVCCSKHNNKLFALELSHARIAEFQLIKDTWTRTRNIDLKYKYGSRYDRIAVKDHLLYVCSYSNKAVFMYDVEEAIEYKHKLNVDISVFFLNGVDRQGSLLISDYYDRKIYIYSEKAFHEIKLEADLKQYYAADVVCTSGGGLWIADLYGKLWKFTAKMGV